MVRGNLGRHIRVMGKSKEGRGVRGRRAGRRREGMNEIKCLETQYCKLIASPGNILPCCKRLQVACELLKLRRKCGKWG